MKSEKQTKTLSLTDINIEQTVNTVHNCKNHKTTDTNQPDKNSKLVQGNKQKNKTKKDKNKTAADPDSHTHTKLPGVKGAVLDGWASTR